LREPPHLDLAAIHHDLHVVPLIRGTPRARVRGQHSPRDPIQQLPQPHLPGVEVQGKAPVIDIAPQETRRKRVLLEIREFDLRLLERINRAPSHLRAILMTYMSLE